MNRPDNNQSYTAIAEQWSGSRNAAPVEPEVIAWSSLLPPGAAILDAGCGTGQPIARYLIDQGFEVTGIDANQALLDQAKVAVPGATFLQADLRTYQTAARYDGIIAWFSIFHLPPQDQLMAYEHLANLLKPWGYFLFSTGGEADGDITGEMYGENFYYASIEPNRLHAWWQDQGFTVLEWQRHGEAPHRHLVGLVRLG